MKKVIKTILFQTIIWSIALAYFTLLRQFGQNLVEEPEPRNLFEFALIYLSLGLVYSIIFVSFETMVAKKINSIKSFGTVILLRSILSLFIFIIMLVAGVIIYMIPQWEMLSFEIITNYLFSNEGVLTLSYLFCVSFLFQFIRQIDKKFGPGNLARMLKGEFHVPKEVDRIVMFLDLKSSTAIAEQIGHLKYSRLIQECFDQLDMIRDFGGEIYQYVGDEVVIIWETKMGLKDSNVLKFYYSYREALLSRESHYKSEYGVVPMFKCGCHMGKVVMTEIGRIKREIAFHGDVMNTAARIQSRCNSLNQKFLLSEELYASLKHDSSFQFEFVGEEILKGKKNNVNIYGVKETQPS